MRKSVFSVACPLKPSIRCNPLRMLIETPCPGCPFSHDHTMRGSQGILTSSDASPLPLNHAGTATPLRDRCFSSYPSLLPLLDITDNTEEEGVSAHRTHRAPHISVEECLDDPLTGFDGDVARAVFYEPRSGRVPAR